MPTTMPGNADQPPAPTVTPWRLGLPTWLATGGWVGLIPIAPGTFGSLLGLPLAWGINALPAAWLQVAVLAGLGLAGIPLCTTAATRLGGAKDPGCIVFDEIIGMAATLLLLGPMRPEAYVLGFLLFRLFDITKPPPARQLERLPAGLGIMADDWVAALYANLSLRVVLWIGDSLLSGTPPVA